MGAVKKPPAVKLVVGLIFKDENILKKCESALERKFGFFDFKSHVLPFEHTQYYEAEFGKNLKRKFFSFKRLIRPESLPAIKIYTNKLERKFSSDQKRLINIDPGFISAAKLVLATTKDYSHRIYLGKGIYAEVTLKYEAGNFTPWPWTYPDFRTPEYHEIFNHLRSLYLAQIQK